MTYPQRAGNSPLLSQLVEGNVVILQSRASGKTLRSLHGTLQGIGGHGAHAQWKVHIRRPGVIALQNEHTPAHWLAIRDGSSIGNAGGGPYCEFIAMEVNGHLVLESSKHRGQHVGVLPDGNIKEPSRTGTGQHAQFTLIVHKSVKVLFTEGSVVFLESVSSGKTLRSLHGKADGIGGRGAHAQWKVHMRRQEVTAFQNEHTPAHWLAIRDGMTIGNAGGGPYCEFIVKENNGNIVLESYKYRGQHVGVLPDGRIKEPARTGTGQHAQFRVIEHKKASPGHQRASPKVHKVHDVSKQMSGLTLNSPVLSVFGHGNVVILESKSSGQTLRSLHGTAEGIGGRGGHAQWKVHLRRPGVIALQNQHTPAHWLAIRDGMTLGNGQGGPFCEFNLQAVGDYVALESVCYPGQHVGVLPDGSIKPPAQTGKGLHGQFKPILHHKCPGSQVPPPAQQYPAPTQPYVPPPSQNPAYPPPYGYPGYQAPPPAGYPGYQPPPAAGYPAYQPPPAAGYPPPPAGGYPGYYPPPPT